MPIHQAKQEAELMTMANGVYTDAGQIKMPMRGFDLTSGTIPILLVIALMGVVAAASWRVSAYVQADVTERTVILSRLDKIEVKLDRALKGDRTARVRAKRQE
jgi:hypothetical protein